MKRFLALFLIIALAVPAIGLAEVDIDFTKYTVDELTEIIGLAENQISVLNGEAEWVRVEPGKFTFDDDYKITLDKLYKDDNTSIFVCFYDQKGNCRTTCFIYSSSVEYRVYKGGYMIIEGAPVNVKFEH